MEKAAKVGGSGRGWNKCELLGDLELGGRWWNELEVSPKLEGGGTRCTFGHWWKAVEKNGSWSKLEGGGTEWKFEVFRRVSMSVEYVTVCETN